LKLIIGKVFDGNYIIEKAFYLIKDGRLFNCFEAEALTSGVSQKHFFVSGFCFQLDIEI
jgi:hypothetical protein